MAFVAFLFISWQFPHDIAMGLALMRESPWQASGAMQTLPTTENWIVIVAHILGACSFHVVSMAVPLCFRYGLGLDGGLSFFTYFLKHRFFEHCSQLV